MSKSAPMQFSKIPTAFSLMWIDIFFLFGTRFHFNFNSSLRLGDDLTVQTYFKIVKVSAWPWNQNSELEYTTKLHPVNYRTERTVSSLLWDTIFMSHKSIWWSGSMKILINAALIIALEKLLFWEYPSAALPKLNFLMCADLHIGSLLLLRGMSTTQTTQQAASFLKVI